MALYTYRQMPPTGPDNISGPLARSVGTRSLFWAPSPDPMKTIHFESAAHYHRLGFDARLILKRIDTRMDTPIHPAVYKYSPSFLYRVFSLSPGDTRMRETFSPVWPLYCVTHRRERNCRAVIYTTDPRYIAIRHSRLWGNDAPRTFSDCGGEEERKKGTGYLLWTAGLDSGEGRGPEKTRKHLRAGNKRWEAWLIPRRYDTLLCNVYFEERV